MHKSEIVCVLSSTHGNRPSPRCLSGDDKVLLTIIWVLGHDYVKYFQFEIVPRDCIGVLE